MKACAGNGRKPTLRELFDESVDDRRLITAVDAPCVFRVICSNSCIARSWRISNAHTDENPAWQISGETFESQLALYQRDQDAFDRGMGAG